MDLGLKGKVVLVMAASRGLGRAVATEYAREGARVMIASRNETELQKTAREIREATGAEVAYCVTDVSKREDIDRLMQETIAKYSTLDVLVNNAGGPPGGKFDDFEDEVWEQAFQSLLLSVVRLVRAALPHLRKNGGGRILNITSSSIKQPLPGLILSNTYRAGILGLAKSLATELGPDNILINTIAPGRIATDRILELDSSRAQATGRSMEEVRTGFEQSIPLGRYGTPEEFARIVTFLGSDANTYVTGQALLIDGGLVQAL